MNTTTTFIFGGILIVGALIGYSLMGGDSPAAHTANDGHAEAEHAAAVGHTAGDGHAEAEHSESTVSAPHDDAGTAAHID